MSAAQDLETAALRTLLTPIEGDRQELTRSDALGPRKLIGMGGMGVVHEVEQRWLRRAVAVKTPRSGDGAEAEFNAERLEREARVLARVEHPNVLPVYELTRTEEGVPQVFMKRIEGIAWHRLLEGGEHALLPEGPMRRLVFHVQILVSVCDAVAHAHRCGVVHLDLKPANVMIGLHGEVYLLDWGVAMGVDRVLTPWLPGVEELEHPVGTPTHMAPEMARGKMNELSRRTDVFMLGATLHQILTGEPPNLADDLEGALECAARAAPPVLPSSVPEDIRQVCSRAMKRKPGERYADGGELAAALRACLLHRAATMVTARASLELRQLAVLLEAEEPEVSAIEASQAAARLGFEEGLARWADNGTAGRGLRDLAAMLVSHYLRVGDLRAARAALQGVVEAPAGLSEQVDAAEARRTNELSVAATFSEAAADERASDHARLRLLAVHSVLGLVLVGTLAWFGFEPGFPHWQAHLVFALAYTMVFPIGAALLREALLPNAASVRMHRTGIGIGLVMIVDRVMAGLSGLEPAQWLAADTVMLALTVGLMGLFSETSTKLATATLLAGTVGCLVWPAGAGLVMMGSALFGTGLVFRGWRKRMLLATLPQKTSG